MIISKVGTCFVMILSPLDPRYLTKIHIMLSIVFFLWDISNKRKEKEIIFFLDHKRRIFDASGVDLAFVQNERT